MADKSKSKQVVYHAPFATPKVLLVLKENKDGTVDIGQLDGTVLVRGVKIVDEPAHGHATLHSSDVDEAKSPSKGEIIKSQLEGKSRDELVAKVVEYNSKASADKKIALTPTINKPELIEELLKVLDKSE